MPDFAGEPVTIKAVNARDSRGNRLDETSAAAAISIYNADKTTQYVTDEPMVWTTLTDPLTLTTSEGWVYDWDTTGRDPGGPYLARVAVTPSAGLTSFEWRDIFLARAPSGTGAGGGTITCGGPWFDPSDSECLKRLEEADRELVVLAACRMLFNATARIFSGVCEETVRPCDASAPGGFGIGARLGDGSLWLGLDGTSALPEITWAGDRLGFGAVRRGVSGGLMEHPAIDLWEIGSPVVEILDVTIDGVTLDPSEYSIVDDRWLIRNGGKCWPFGQRLDLPAGSPHTWSITFSFGVPYTPDGVLAARVLSCELAKAPAFLNDDSCRLPRRIQTITRENVTSVVIDPMKWLTDGKFGIYEVDAFVHGVNPHGITREGRVLNPDLLATMPRRVR